MNIYLIERTDGDIGYDEFCGFVVCAKDARQAKSLMQSADEVDHAKWKVTKVGTTHYKKPRVLLTDFNAG